PQVIFEAAKREARRITERWDVPETIVVNGETVPAPAHLLDRHPRMLTTKDGRAIGSLLWLDDMETGGPSPAIPFLFAMVPVLSILQAVLSAMKLTNLAVLVMLLVCASIIFVWQATRSRVFTLTVAVLLALPSLPHLASLPGFASLPVFALLLGFLPLLCLGGLTLLV